ncbi:MAG: S8 family peptidase [Bryobacteraceae bacterium]
MPIYIVKPVRGRARERATLVNRPMDGRHRVRHFHEALEARRCEPVDEDLRRWFQEAEERGVRRLGHAEEECITSTRVVAMSHGEAEKLAKEVPGLSVTLDQPLAGVDPHVDQGSITLDPSAIDRWHLNEIGLSAARQSGFTGTGNGVTVAVLDTGVEGRHPEIESRIAGAFTFHLDEPHVRAMDPPRETDPVRGHGTHVAGLIAGKTVGVAPGASLLAGVVQPNFVSSVGLLEMGLQWCLRPENGIQIVNMSVGVNGYNDVMKDEIAALLLLGILPVLAVGNLGRNTSASPGNYNEPLTVGASNRAGRIGGYSGSQQLQVDHATYQVPDLVAPGTEVWSAWYPGGYIKDTGTSMATPIVSGIAALIIERHPDIEVADLVELLMSTCRDLGQPPDRQGRGLAQVQAAVT